MSNVIGILAGSLRKESFSKKVGKTLLDFVPEGQGLVFLNMPTMQQPEVYIAHVNDLFDEKGNMKEGDTKDFLKKAVESYIVWFNKNSE